MFDLSKKNNYDIGLKILSVGLSLWAIKNLINYTVLAPEYFGKNGITPLNIYSGTLRYLHLSFLNFIFTDPLSIYIFLSFALIAAVLFLFDYYRLVSGLFLFVCLILIHLRNVFIIDGSDNLYPLLIFFLAFYNPKKKQKPKVASDKISLAIKIQLCLVYFFAGIWKIRGTLWRHGTALYYVLQVNSFNATFVSRFIVAHPILFHTLTYLTLVFEISFPFLIWYRKTRIPIIIIGICFHIGIFAAMRIDNFSLVMILSYSALITDREFRLLFKSLKKNYSIASNKVKKL